MKYRLILDGTKITGVMTDGFTDLDPVGAGPLVESQATPSDMLSSYIFVSGELRNVGPSPNTFYRYDLELGAWVDPRPLHELQAEKWAEIKRNRDTAEFGGFTWDGSPFDSDAISQSRIQGAVQLAAMAPGFTIDWTLADNTTMTLTKAEVIGLGMALGAHIASVHSRGRVLRALIEAPDATVESVEAITWDSAAYNPPQP